mgnify:CR=1 FL=1
MIDQTDKYLEYCQYRGESIACGYEYLDYSDWLRGNNEEYAHAKLAYHLRNDTLDLY